MAEGTITPDHSHPLGWDFWQNYNKIKNSNLFNELLYIYCNRIENRKIITLV